MVLAKIITIQWCSAVCTAKCKQTNVNKQTMSANHSARFTPAGRPITARDSRQLAGKK